MEGPFFLPEAPNRYKLAPSSELSDPDQFVLLRGVVRDRRSDMQTMFGDVYRRLDTGRLYRSLFMGCVKDLAGAFYREKAQQDTFT